jgi:hypothetical protein
MLTLKAYTAAGNPCGRPVTVGDLAAARVEIDRQLAVMGVAALATISARIDAVDSSGAVIWQWFSHVPTLGELEEAP